MSDDKKSGTAVLDRITNPRADAAQSESDQHLASPNHKDYRDTIKKDQEHERHIHELSEKAGERIRRLALTIKANPKLRKEIEELAHDLEGSVHRLAGRARTEEALIEQVEAAVSKAEHYIENVAKAEEKKEHEEEKKHTEHNAHPHAPEKPKSAEKTPEEKAHEELNEFRAEVAAAAVGGAAVATFTAALENNKRNQTAIAGEKATNTSVSSIKDSNRPGKQKSSARERLKSLRQRVFRPRKGKTEITTPFPGGPAEKKMPLYPSKFRERLRQRVTTRSFPPFSISSRPIFTKIHLGSMARSLSASYGFNTSSDGGDDNAYDDSGGEAMDRGRSISGNNRSAQPQSSSGASEQAQDSSGGSQNNDDQKPHGNPRAARKALNNARNASGHGPSPKGSPGGGSGGPGGIGNGAAKGAAKGAGNIAKTAAKTAVKTALKDPRVLLALAIVTLIILAILFIVYMLVGDEATKQSQRSAQCQIAPETLTVAAVGPTTAVAGETLTYEIKITDTVPNQEITVVATIPEGVSTAAADVTSSWTKFTLTGNTITWKATENLPPDSLGTPNITFTVTLKAVAPSINAILVVDATPMRTAAAPAGGGEVAGGEKSTEELMAIYGGTQAEVEANLVTITFQGKTYRVHKLVQGAFEKVDAEITAANTGYQFKSVGTYVWRPKNIPGKNSTELSTHSFGITMDINPETNPYTTSDTHDIPPAVADAFKRNGFAWGGDWRPSKDWMHFQYEGAAGAIAPGAGGTNCAPGGSGGPAVGYVPPSAETCKGKYTLNSSLGMNFGDPQCNFNKDALYTQLQQEDPANADVWFNKVVPCESGYNPNAFADPVAVGTPDAAGAWGLYQMGSATPPGTAPPAKGKNGINDRGDVPWNVQTTNATTYGKRISSLGAYWSCAR